MSAVECDVAVAAVIGPAGALNPIGSTWKGDFGGGGPPRRIAAPPSGRGIFTPRVACACGTVTCDRFAWNISGYVASADLGSTARRDRAIGRMSYAVSDTPG